VGTRSKEPDPRGRIAGSIFSQAGNLFTSCSVTEGVIDHCGVLLEVEWEEKYCRPIVERRVPVYHKADTMGLQTFSPR
jgi:hypothetical protein